MSTELHLLVPAAQLPEEAAESPRFSGNSNARELLRWLTGHLQNPAIAFRITPEGTEFSGGPVALEHIRLLWVPGETDTPWISTTGASLDLELDDLFETGMPRYQGQETPVEDQIRDLLAKVKGAAAPVLSGFRGDPMPLLEWIPDDDGGGAGHAIFHGFWLADPADLAQLPGWSEHAGDGLIFEEADVEGRGLREMTAAVLMLGVVFGGQPLGAADHAPAPKTEQKVTLVSKLRSLFSRDDTAAKPAPAKQPAATVKAAAAKPAPVKATAKAKKSTPAKQSPASINKDLLAQSCSENVRVVVDLSKQRAYLLVDGQIALDTPVSSGAPGRSTPRGTFTITEKVRTGKRSTLYHCPLPYWMRLGESAVGMHIGELPGYAASHGCVRLPSDIAPIVFDHTYKGTSVSVLESWSPTPAPAAGMIASK
ncbi:MAG: L,D-transpeptidase [Verrucomicrobiales bacterium]|nr:L,D-transpeptidase [Verrucomicrobiales bacterium]